MSLWSSTENSLYHSAEAFSWFPFVPQPGLSTWATVDQGDSSWIKGFHSGKLKLASSLAVHFTLSLRVTPQKKLIIQGSHGLLSPWVKRSALHSHPLISVKSKWGVSLWIWSTKTKWQISRSCVLLTIGKLKSLLFGWDAWRIFFFFFFFFVRKSTWEFACCSWHSQTILTHPTSQIQINGKSTSIFLLINFWMDF